MKKLCWVFACSMLVAACGSSSGDGVESPSITEVDPNEGSTAGGDTVTIHGEHLLTAESVTFGGVAGTSLNVLDDEQLVIVTPAHAEGAVDVVVTTEHGEDTVSDGFTYEEPPVPPVFTNINPTSGAASGGTGFTITGTDLTGTTSVTFDGVAATSVNVVSSTTVTGVTPAHAVGAVDVVVTTGMGSDTEVNGFTYITTALGQTLYGGTVACLGTGLNDLIATSADQSGGIGWGGSGTTIGAGSVVDGATTTTAIVTALGAGNTYAAGVCDAHEIDSQGNTPCESGNTCYNDWFLPARQQLVCLSNNKVEITGFTLTEYWSSSEISDTNATSVDFATSTPFGNRAKTESFRMRCTRTFTP